MASEPRRVSVEPILSEPGSSDGVTAVGTGDGEGNNEKNEKKKNENGHEKKVNGQKTRAVTVSADETDERDEEEEASENHHRPPEKLDAFVVRLGSEPDSGGDDRDGT